MKTPQSKITIIVVCVCALLSACASPSRQAARPPGVIGVVYTQVYPDGGRLKEIPTEVTIVKREATTSLVGAQVALNVVMLAQFAILTAARTSEVIGARWEEIDMEAGLWTIPAQRMKARRAHRVPLTDPVLAVL